MILVRAAELGQPSYARSLREGTLLPLTRSAAVPTDVPVSATLRALALAPDIPSGAVVTALAGVWLRHGGTCPSSIDVLRSRGTHRVTPRAATSPRLRVHAARGGLPETTPLGPLDVASPARCLADALRWAALSDAIPLVWREVTSGRVAAADVAAAIAAAPPDGARVRAASAWNAMEGAWRADRPRHERRLAA